MSEQNNMQPSRQPDSASGQRQAATPAPANRGQASTPPMTAVKQPTSGLAIAGLVLGIIAALTSFVPIVNNLSFFIALVGLALAIAGFIGTRKGKKSGKGIAIAGIVLGIVSAAVVLVTQAMFSAALDSVSEELNAGSTLVSSSATQEGAASQSADSNASAADYQNLAVGTTIDLKNGLSVTVNAVESGLVNYDGSEVVRVNVTYVNNGDKNTSFNVFDWKAEDASGAQRSEAYYSDGADELSSGQLSAGGSTSGNIYFDAPVVKVHYYGSMFDDVSTAAWAV